MVSDEMDYLTKTYSDKPFTVLTDKYEVRIKRIGDAVKSCTTCAYYSPHPCQHTSGEVGDCYADDRTIRKIFDTEARNCDGFGYERKPQPPELDTERRYPCPDCGVSHG